MTDNPSSDIMNRILSGREDEPTREGTRLDCLIYRNASDLPEHLMPDDGKVLELTRGNVSVQVWESRAKIRVKISSGSDKVLSMTRIAQVAMDAILEELNKEAE
jgi:hypothetical protein